MYLLIILLFGLGFVTVVLSCVWIFQRSLSLFGIKEIGFWKAFKTIFMIEAVSLLLGTIVSLLPLPTPLIYLLNFILGLVVYIYVLHKYFGLNIGKSIGIYFLNRVLFLIAVGIIVIALRLFVGNPYTNVSSGMAPSLVDGDIMFVDKLSGRFSGWARGDVIVFVPSNKTIPYVKRIVGLPGETIKVQNNKVLVCDSGDKCTELKEDYLPANTKTTLRCGKDTFELDKGYFVLGDNRNFSTDSLCCFDLSCDTGSSYEVLPANIIGKVIAKLFPSFQILK